MRTFAAVWPPEDVLDHLDLALATVRGGPAGASGAVRWSARETWHLTTAFYGDVPDGAVAGLAAALREECSALGPYELALRGAGVFSHRTVWVGATGAVDAHRVLTTACGAAGEQVGAHDDGRARERPHLTIGRARPGSGTQRRPLRRRSPRGPARPGEPVPDDPVASLVRALAVYEGPRWTVGSVLLVESRPGEGRGGGPLYRTLAEAPLLG
ncbi:RNA 2',3'-cyclic phosphodiesterase [Cellulomonas sp. HZM]|uniref:RNA 2',3'-cyclic phosphodiesterase n=1 Tax=Cellulomonas sp. HZM TaxID=1454010 RepID=UPI0004934FFD|nr:RNA 2',3'-cyclic phosphodiesterase [Cellulomonas sp. HZM]